MSSFLAKVIRSSLSSANRIRVVPNFRVNTPSSPIKNLSSRTENSDDISSSTTFQQHGSDIQELPVIVRKTNEILINKLKDHINSKPGTEESVDYEQEEYVKAEIMAIKEGLNKCRTLDELLALLECVPSSEVGSDLAAHILQCISTLQQYSKSPDSSLDKDQAKFTEKAVIHELCEIVCQSKDSASALTTLKSVSKTATALGVWELALKKLVVHNLNLLSSGHMKEIKQLCELIRILSELPFGYSRHVDDVWMGINESANDIDEKSLVDIYSILPLLRKSRKLVLDVAEKRTFVLWWQLSVTDIVDIVAILTKLQLSRLDLFLSFGKWMNVNINQLDEDSVVQLSRCFAKLQHSEPNLQKAFERYLKWRLQKVTNILTVCSVLHWCSVNRVRSDVILDSSANYVIAKSSSIAPQYLTTILSTFARFNFEPSNSQEFFRAVEIILNNKFVQFRPGDMIDSLLACVYLQRHPLNFVRKIFNPFFLDRLHSVQDVAELRKARMCLHLLDTALTLDCPRQYKGPLLPTSSNFPVFRDNRLVKFLRSDISESLCDILGGVEKYQALVSVPGLPHLSLYLADCLIHFNENSKPLDTFIRTGIAKRLVILFHLPEHYHRMGEESTLNGAQLARVRHFKAAGYSVIQLNYEQLMVMIKGDPYKVSTVLRRNITEAITKKI